MRTALLLMALWSIVSVAGVRRWSQVRAVDRRDRQLRALLTGAVVPAPRDPADAQRGLTKIV